MPRSTPCCDPPQIRRTLWSPIGCHELIDKRAGHRTEPARVGDQAGWFEPHVDAWLMRVSQKAVADFIRFKAVYMLWWEEGPTTRPPVPPRPTPKPPSPSTEPPICNKKPDLPQCNPPR